MSKIVAVHSFRGGTGKSNTVANTAALLANDGLRVGVIDTDIQSPGVHVLFGLSEAELSPSLDDYLWGKCAIKETIHDVTERLTAPVKGKVFLIPSSIKANDIARILRDGYDVGLLNDGFTDVVAEASLDALIIDTHPGMNEETLLSISVADALAIILRPDQQDYQGTSVTVEVARKLDVPRLLLIVNKVPSGFDFGDVKAQVEQTYNCTVGAILPHSDEMMTLASAGIFVLRYPDHVITKSLRDVAAVLIS